jgi:hypothetical protein
VAGVERLKQAPGVSPLGGGRVMLVWERVPVGSEALGGTAMICDCCKETVHRVDEDELCFGCSIIQDFVAIIEEKTDTSGPEAVGLAYKLVELLRSRILELGRDVGAEERAAFFEDVAKGMIRGASSH